MSEEITKYQQQWNEYQNEKGNGCLFGMIVLPFFALTVYLAREFLTHPTEIIVGILGLVLILSWLFKQPKWTCPRCGGDFYSRWKHHNLTRAKICIDCQLPIYYGSTYFFDYWGTERGNEQAEQVRQQENLRK